MSGDCHIHMILDGVYYRAAIDAQREQPDEALVRAENRVREALGVPIYNTRGVRCQGHNRAVGGVENSLHLTGKAVDFYAPGKSAGELLALAKAQPEIVYAYAIDGSAVHMNVAR